jgi:alpha-D-xyloside xylohydrolase
MISSTGSKKAEPMRWTFNRLLAALACGFLICPYLFAEPILVESVQKDISGVTLRMKVGTMRVQICAGNIIHIEYTPLEMIPMQVVPVVNRQWKPVPFTLKSSGKDVELATHGLEVRVDRSTGAVGFYTLNGAQILQEPADGGKSMAPAVVAGKKTWHPEQVFLSPPGESLYGLGQFPEGLMDWRGIPLRLQEVNTQIALPMLLSSRGYGLLWDNPSLTDFDPTNRLIPTDPTTGEGRFITGKAGVYGFMIRGGNARNELSLTVDGQPVIDLNDVWVPYTASGRVQLAGHTQHTVVVRGGGSDVRVYLLSPSDTFAFCSQMGAAINYFFMYGPNLGKVIAEYREATGAAPLFPKWAYGFWQCRERYSSQKQLLDAAAEFRQRKIPVDVMVQDWQYWGKYGWDAMKFDEQYYPNPAAMIRELHQEHLHFVISVWSRFAKQTQLYKEMKARSLLVPGTDWFDAFNPEAQRLFWLAMKNGLFKLGVDGWWLDATEPEGDILKDVPTYVGIGNLVRNAYPFYVTRAVYRGQRAATQSKRVCILTRSAFPGEQRHAAACWSGDIRGNWETFRRQIPNGLNFCMAGMPYWTTDIGGFFRPKDEYTSLAYHELLIRWYEFGAFCPIFRIHGYQTATEMWNFGQEVLADLHEYDGLRYRLMPYIYSLAWKVTNDGYTLMRALPLDFRTDARVAHIKDQFMFGPAFLVSPVTRPDASSRDLYLPKAPVWYNFWTGESKKGGQRISATAPLETLPLFVRAGSIVPMGPYIQYAGEKSGPIELRIYRGANSAFTLYEDQGDGYGYEHGLRATIPIRWNDATQTLTIGRRIGHYPGMPEKMTFQIVWVRKDHGVGMPPAELPDQTVTYTGRSVSTREE